MDYQNPQTASQPRQNLRSTINNPRSILPKGINLSPQFLNFIQNNKRTITIASAALLLFFGASALYNNFFGETRTITVTGIGRKTAQAEKATLSFSFAYSSTSESQVISQGEERFNNIISEITKFQPDEIDKNSYQVVDNSRNTLGSNGSLTRAGSFQYVNAAQITTTKLDTVNDIVKTLYDAGATQVTQVRYLPKNEDKFDQELRELAVKDAKSNARKMARASGAWLGSALNIQEAGSNGETGTSVNALTNNGEEGFDLTSIGEIELESAVVVTYQLR